MRHIFLFLLSLAAGNLLLGEVAQSVIRLERQPWGPMLWPSNVPDDCPVERSDELAGVVFTGRSADYTYADTWYPSWASDGNLYSPYTDGVSGVWAKSRSSRRKASVTGHAKIEGSDPLDLKITPLGVYPGSAEPYLGRYPSGSLVHDGIWYYGTYFLDQEPPGYNLGTLGSFVGFRISHDYGKSWIDCPHSGDGGVFGESGKDGGVVKIGAPHFVDFGKNMEHSPDGKAYLVGHGAMPDDPEPRPANLSWISGDQVYLIRVDPSPETVNDKDSYEFFCGFDDRRQPIWCDDFERIQPIFEWNNHCGCVTITYNAALQKYIMCITDGWPTIKFMDTYFLEADRIEGPWKMVAYLESFGEQGYFVNIPTKFIGNDGRTCWLSYSGNFATFEDLKVNPPGGRYGWILQEIQLLSKQQLADYPAEENAKQLGEATARWERENPLTSTHNLALRANVVSSSTHPDYDHNAVIDGVVGGYPHSPENEWASDKQTAGATIRLSWSESVAASKIWLFDRPSHNEHILAGELTLSDGTVIEVSELPNSEYAGREIAFGTKKLDWIEFEVQRVGRATNIGLAEIAVFE